MTNHTIRLAVHSAKMAIRLACVLGLDDFPINLLSTGFMGKSSKPSTQAKHAGQNGPASARVHGPCG